MTTEAYNLHATSRPTLVSLVEENITNLVQEAIIVHRHCKRARVFTSNPNDPDSDVIKRRLHADDVNMALQWRGSEKLYATGTITTSLTGSDSSKKVDLEEYLKSEMDINAPQEVGLTTHWLAVDGEQPEIPQNPISPKKRKTASTSGADGNGPDAVPSDDGGTAFVNDGIINEDEDDPTKSGIHVNQLLPRLLSEELQLYFSRVTTALEQGGPTPMARRQQDAALQSVATDSGLQELVPFFVDYVCKSLYKHLGNSDHCRTLVRLVHSLLMNPHMHLELHLHQLLPILFTCIVAKKLSSNASENHWSLRDDAAKTLAQACNLFGDEYVTLKAQVLKTLCGAAAPTDARGKRQSLPTTYGGFVGIMLFGPKAIDAFLLPLALGYWNQWEAQLETTTNLAARLDIQMCQQIALHAIGVYLRQASSSAKNVPGEWQQLEETFADRLVPMCEEPEEYALCFV